MRYGLANPAPMLSADAQGHREALYRKELVEAVRDDGIDIGGYMACSRVIWRGLSPALFV